MSIQNEINRFDENSGIESSETPPATWCTMLEFHELDQKLLKKQWQFVASVDQLKAPGSFVAGEFCNEQYFVTRTEQGILKAFYNVCRHHAAQLLTGDGCAKEIVCPYHAWTYNLDGELKKAPQIAGVKNFNREKLSLKEIPLRVFNKFIMLNFSNDVKELDPELDKLNALLIDMKTEALQFRGRRVYEINCNWKVYIDNYLDGGYHVDHLHKGLAGQLEMTDYQIQNYTNWTLQSCAAAKNPIRNDSIDFKERIGKEAIYAWLYPNFMINRYGNIMDTNWIIPVGHLKCLTVFDYYFMPDADDHFVAASIKASEQVQIEDVAICESVQKGLLSSGYEAGRYAPTLETGEYLFHTKLKRDYLEGLK